MNKEQVYLLAQKLCDIGVGDNVRILRRAVSHELGWPGQWLNDDVPVGETGSVVRIDDNGITVDLGKYGERTFPYFVLDKIASAPFSPFDRVIVRDNKNALWTAAIFSHYDSVSHAPYVACGRRWRLCAPYEGNEDLVGTSEQPEQIA